MWSVRVLSVYLLTPVLHAAVIPYVGGIGGIATLSADAAAQPTSLGLRESSYSPNNGAAVNLFAGLGVTNFISLQVNYIWSENHLVLSSASSGSVTFYQQARTSSQQAGIFDFLLYFRRRSSWVRPYLGTGGGIIHLRSQAERLIASGGTPQLPPATFSSTRPVFRSHVGMDLRLSRALDFRYSFSELIGKNDISQHLSPPASRRLANFENRFGFVWRF